MPKPIRVFPVTLDEYSYYQGITSTLKKPNKKLFAHILGSTLSQFHQFQGWIPIGRARMDKWFLGCDPKVLQSSGLIEVDENYIVGKQSRRYKVVDEILNEFLGLQNFGPTSSQTLINLVDGKPYIRLEAEESGNPVIDASIRAIKRCVYDRDAVIEHLKQSKETYSRLKGSNEGERLRLRLLNDLISFRTVERLNPQPIGNNLYSFTPEYRSQKNGRIGFVGGGLQTATREMKAAAFPRDKGFINYDLVSAQARILLVEFQAAGLTCEWLETYLERREYRKACAESVGIGYDLWKDVFFALTMGANPGGQNLKDKLLAEVPPDKTGETLKAIRQIVKPLFTPLWHWHKHIVKESEENEILTNSCGVTRLSKSFSKSRSELAAFYLQGVEAYFIHTLCSLSEKYNFEVVANEYDGLVCLGKIPKEAINETRQITGINYLELIEKDFL